MRFIAEWIEKRLERKDKIVSKLTRQELQHHFRKPQMPRLWITHNKGHIRYHHYSTCHHYNHHHHHYFIMQSSWPWWLLSSSFLNCFVAMVINCFVAMVINCFVAMVMPTNWNKQQSQLWCNSNIQFDSANCLESTTSLH